MAAVANLFMKNVILAMLATLGCPFVAPFLETHV